MNLFNKDFSSNNNKLYNNADSFIIEFDEAWRSFKKYNKEVDLTIEEKLKIVLDEIRYHPFLKESYNKAKRVAEFRIEMLKLK